jgi:ATP-dependent RNA helicase RhlE
MPLDIQELADNILNEPVRVEVAPQATTVELIEQSVYFVDKKNKRALLEHLLEDRGIRRVLVFTRTKHGANRLAEQLEGSRIQAEAIHGNKSQTARERALANFKSGRTRVLVATDIAARGIDVDDVTHVINFDLPNEPESYVHRIGRTARAGASGIAFSFCDVEERAYLRDIERLIRLTVPVVGEHPYKSTVTSAPRSNGSSSNGGYKGNRGGGSREPRRDSQSQNQRRGGRPNGGMVASSGDSDSRGMSEPDSSDRPSRHWRNRSSNR